MSEGRQEFCVQYIPLLLCFNSTPLIVYHFETSDA